MNGSAPVPVAKPSTPWQPATPPPVHAAQPKSQTNTASWKPVSINQTPSPSPSKSNSPNSMNGHKPLKNNPSFTDLMIDSPNQRRKMLPAVPTSKPEIMIRTPEEKSNFNFTWDDESIVETRRSLPTNIQSGHEFSIHDDEHRQPDVIVEMKPCATPDLHSIRPEDQSNDQNDTASICSFNSEVHDPSYHSPQSMADFPKSPVPTNHSPQSSVISDRQMTPSAGLLAAAFKTGAIPKLKEVNEPVVKNGTMPKTAQNSVQKEKELLFQDQQRQRQQKQQQERELQQQEREFQQQKLDEQKKQQQLSVQLQTASPKTQNSRKVHFSQLEAERQQLSSNNYNKSAAAFQHNFNQETAATCHTPITKSNSLPTPITNLPPSNSISASIPMSLSGRKVATPKFRAAAPRQQAWTPGGENHQKSSSSIGACESLSANLSQNPSSERAAAAPSRWVPGNKPVPPLKIDSFPSSNSLIMDNLNATYSEEKSAYPPQATHQKRHQSLPSTPPHNGHTHSQSFTLPPQQRSPSSHKTPPPTPTKPKSWIPGMKADPNQFNVTKTYKTGPPPPPKKTSFASSDLIAGPQAMTQKFETGTTPQPYTPVMPFTFSHNLNNSHIM